jgi:hypothetical protein
MEQAIECVKNGGRAELKGAGDTTWAKIRRTKSGRVRYRYSDGTYCYSGDFYRNWNYRITRPAPEKTYPTAEAIAEVIATGCEMAGGLNSEHASFELKFDRDGDLRCSRTGVIGCINYIPTKATWRKKPVESKKPKSISGVISGPRIDFDDIRDAIHCINGNHKLTWTVESVD